MPARRIAVGLFAVTFVTYAWFFGGGGWNQNAHFDLTRALVERQTLHIDGYRVNTGDISWSKAGHAYSNKPPGLPFLAALPYAVLMNVERAMKVSLDSWEVMTINVYLLTLITVAIPGALIPVLLYTYLRKRGTPLIRPSGTFSPHGGEKGNVGVGCPSPRLRGEGGRRPGEGLGAVYVALIAAFATIVFPYSTMFFSPVPAAFFLLLAFVWLDERPLLAGIAAGIAGMCYYPCILAAGVFAIGAKKKLPFILGGLPSGVILAIYHTLCFGVPWRTSHKVEGWFQLPRWDAFWGLTFSEYRGLFFVSPVLLLAFVGAFYMKSKRDLLMIGAVVVLFLAVVSSFNGWEGGFAFGPRHILPMIPLLAIPIAYVRGKVFIAIGIVLAIASVSMQFIATAVDAMPDSGIRYPVRDYLVPKFLEGDVGRNQQSVDELIPNWIHKKGTRESQWAAFNLGEFILPRNVSWVPIALWMLIGSSWLIRQARR